MPLDDLVLGLQATFDRLIRRLRLGAPPVSGPRRLLIVADRRALAAVLEHAIARGRVPFLARLLRRRGYQMVPMCAGLPTSTPAFQLAAMYGVRPDIPGFHYHDKRRKSTSYFREGATRAHVEHTQARDGGASWRAAEPTAASSPAAPQQSSDLRDDQASERGRADRAASMVVVIAWVLVKGMVTSTVEVVRTLLRMIADPVSASTAGWKWLAIKLGISVWLRELFTLAVAHEHLRRRADDLRQLSRLRHRRPAWGPRHRRALPSLRKVDASIQRLWRVLRRVPEHR